MLDVMYSHMATDLDRRIILKWTVDIAYGRLGMEFTWFRVGTGGRHL
jgi:hypothetical protein